MSKAFAMIMAGGPSRSMSALTDIRVAAAIPFGGKFRLIDFSLSNCVHSDIYNVAVLTQYLPQSLNDHLGTGSPWDLDLMTGGLRVLHPYQGGRFGDWQRGTADAVRRNLDYVRQQNEDHVLILSGDHIYMMDYRPLLAQHEASGADLTMAVRRVSPFEAHRYGIVTMSKDGRVESFEEKPKRSRSRKLPAPAASAGRSADGPEAAPAVLLGASSRSSSSAPSVTMSVRLAPRLRALSAARPITCSSSRTLPGQA